MTDNLNFRNGLVVVLCFTSIITLYLAIRKTGINEAADLKTSDVKNDTTTGSTGFNNRIVLKKPKRLPKPKIQIYVPSCKYGAYLEIKLNEIIEEIKFKHVHCFPDEWQKEHGCDKSSASAKWRQKILDKDSRSVGVLWCVVGLLIISMFAALIDVCNAKYEQMKHSNSINEITGRHNVVSHNPRRCSLQASLNKQAAKRQAFGATRPSTIAEGPPLRRNASAGTPTDKLD